MAKKKLEVPKYGTITLKGIQYYSNVIKLRKAGLHRNVRSSFL